MISYLKKYKTVEGVPVAINLIIGTYAYGEIMYPPGSLESEHVWYLDGASVYSTDELNLVEVDNG